MLLGRRILARRVLQVPLALGRRDDVHADAVAVGDGAEREPMVPPKPRLVAVEPSCIAGARIGRGSTSGGMLRCDMACGRCGREPSPPAARSPEPCMGGPCGGSGAPSVLSDMAKENVPCVARMKPPIALFGNNKDS